jgi:phage N-6-adenine-methyltransferase
MKKPDWWTSDHWSTPPKLVEQLASEFGPFDLDPCCETKTAKAPIFYTPDVDGLSQPWFGKVWLNPPYSRPEPWVAKAAFEMEQGTTSLVVALLPVATDTLWFHNFVLGHADLRFIKGRVRFYGWENTPINRPKSPSMLAIYRKCLW